MQLRKRATPAMSAVHPGFDPAATRLPAVRLQMLNHSKVAKGLLCMLTLWLPWVFRGTGVAESSLPPLRSPVARPALHAAHVALPDRQCRASQFTLCAANSAC